MISQAPLPTLADYERIWSSPETEEHALISEFLCPGYTTFLHADEGIGKSTLMTQLAVSAACGLPVFGILEVARPLRVYYLAFETRLDNHARAVARMKDELAVDLALFKENFKFDPHQVDLDLQHTDVTGHLIDAEVLITRILSNLKAPDLVILDPLYLAVTSDLIEGPAARAIVTFCNKIESLTGCSCLAVHHTHRKKYTLMGKEVDEDDPFYGSRWLKAHAAVAWYLRKTPTGTELLLKKDRFSLSRKHIELSYNTETLVSTCDGMAKASVKDRLLALFRGNVGGSWTWDALAVALGCNSNWLRVPLADEEVKAHYRKEVGGGRGKPTRFVAISPR